MAFGQQENDARHEKFKPTIEIQTDLADGQRGDIAHIGAKNVGSRVEGASDVWPWNVLGIKRAPCPELTSMLMRRSKSSVPITLHG
jgi:hypothetical protein